MKSDAPESKQKTRNEIRVLQKQRVINSTLKQGMKSGAQRVKQINSTESY